MDRSQASSRVLLRLRRVNQLLLRRSRARLLAAPSCRLDLDPSISSLLLKRRNEAQLSACSGRASLRHRQLRRPHRLRVQRRMPRQNVLRLNAQRKRNVLLLPSSPRNARRPQRPSVRRRWRPPRLARRNSSAWLLRGRQLPRLSARKLSPRERNKRVLPRKRRPSSSALLRKTRPLFRRRSRLRRQLPELVSAYLVSVAVPNPLRRPHRHLPPLPKRRALRSVCLVRMVALLHPHLQNPRPLALVLPHWPPRLARNSKQNLLKSVRQPRRLARLKPKQSARLPPRLLQQRRKNRSDWRKRRGPPPPLLLRPSVPPQLKLPLKRRKRPTQREPPLRLKSPSRRPHLVLPSISLVVLVAEEVSLLQPQLRSKQLRPLP